MFWLTDFRVQVFPPGHTFDIFPGTSTEALYGFVGIGANVVPSMAPSVLNIVTDGMNDQGLSVAVHSQYRAQYQAPEERPTSRVLWMLVASWLLGSFKNVGEVKEAVLSGQYHITNGPNQEAWQRFAKVAGMHWAIADKDGESIVLEYERGEPKVYRNVVGVMTNDPFFAWHVENLNAHSWLSWQSDQNRRAVEISVDTGDLLAGQVQVPQNMGHGFNLGGLPGDHSPPSRFLRTFFMKQISQHNSPKPANAWQAVGMAQAILNHVFIPQGSTGPDPEVTSLACKLSPSLCSLVNSDFTIWDTLRIPQKGWMAFRTYADGQWAYINLKELDWTPKSWPMPHLKLRSLEDLNMKDITAMLNGPAQQVEAQDASLSGFDII